MILADVYQVLTDNDRVARGDEFALASIADKHIWGPCESFVGRRVCDVADNGKIVFRRRIAQDSASV